MLARVNCSKVGCRMLRLCRITGSKSKSELTVISTDPANSQFWQSEHCLATVVNGAWTAPH